MTRSDRLTVFVSDPGSLLTDYRPHGDGLTAWGFVSRLVARGHTVHVAASAVDLSQAPPPRLIIHPYAISDSLLLPFPLQAMLRIRHIFRRLRRDVQFDLIHQLNPVRQGLTSLLIRERVPIVLGPYVPRWAPSQSPRAKPPLLSAALQRVPQLVARRLAIAQERRAAALLLTTPAAREVLHAPKAHAYKTAFLPCGVDTRVFTPGVDAGPSEGGHSPSILFLANLHARKGIHTLLDAFEQVSERIPNCGLRIAGEGPEGDNVRARIAAMRCGRNISMLGAVQRPNVPAVLRSGTVYCLPSYGEPFCVSAIEAMACGKPLVVTDALGLAYLIDDPEGGRKVPPRDAVALAEALIQLLSTPDLCHSMGIYNRQKAVQNYDWDVVIDRLEGIYRKVLSTQSPTH